jgi:ATP-dependent helicase HrpA
VTAALDRTALAEPWPLDRAAFSARRDETKGKLNLIAQEIARLVTTIVQEASAAAKKVNGARAFAAAVADIEQQMRRLFAPRFIIDTPPAQLAHYPRYLQAIAQRLDKLKSDPPRDAQRLQEIAPLQAQLERALAARKGVTDPQLEEYRWLLEELRVSLFAQELRTPMPVSVKRLHKVWASAQR